LKKLAKVKNNFFGFILLIFITFSNVIAAQTAADTLRIDLSESFSKRTFSTDLNKKYNDKSYNYEDALKEYKLNLWQKFLKWLTEIIQKIFNFTNPGKAMDLIIWIFKISGILLIIFVLYKIVKALINEEGNWIFGRKSDKIEIISHDLEQNILQTDFQVLVKQAIEYKQYRLAIRYYYLWSLKYLAQNNKIEWHFEKTNLDYLNELENKELKSQFGYLSYLYNYCWYGEFSLDEHEFKAGESTFKNFLKTL